MLSVEHVTKQYGNFTALEDISLTFTPGVYGLLAPNGAGKTTLIKMLTTLLFPTRGQILWNGEDILALGETYRGVLGYLPQEFGYYPGYTPRQFLRYVAALQRIPRKEADRRIEGLLDTVGLASDAGRKLRQFSGGMLQRVGIATALVGDPEVVILDEPTAGVDPKERFQFYKTIQACFPDKIVLISTHILDDVDFLATNVIMVSGGRIRYTGSYEQFKNTLKDRKREATVEDIWMYYQNGGDEDV